MPKFLEDKLKQEYGDNPHAIYGTMNKIGAMHGNKETDKGRQMEAKHAAKVAGIKRAEEGDYAGPDDYDQMPLPTPQPRSKFDVGPNMASVPPMPSQPGPEAAPMPEPSAMPDSGPPSPSVRQTVLSTVPEQDAGYDPVKRARMIGGLEARDEMPPNPSPSGFGEGPGATALKEATRKYMDIAGKKVPWWQTALGVALSATRHGQAAAPLLMQPRGLGQAERQMKALQGQAEEERKQQASASNERLREESIGYTHEAKLNEIAQRNASAKHPETVQDRAAYLPKLLESFPHLTEEQQAAYVVNAKLPEFAPKNKPTPIRTRPGDKLQDPEDPTKTVFTNPVAPKPTKAQEIQEGVDARTAIADKNHLTGSERHHYIYQTPMPPASTTVNNNWTPQQAAAAQKTPAPGGLNEEFLATFSPKDQAIIKMIAKYDYPLPKGRGSLDKNSGLIAAAGTYDPSFSAGEYDNRQKTKQYYGGGGKGGENLTALSTSLVHLGGLSKAADTLDNSSFRKYNTFANWLSNEVGNPQTKPFSNYRTAFAEEMARALKGGVATNEEIGQWQHNIDMADSPAALKSSIGDVANIIEGRIKQQEANYFRAMKKNPDSPFIFPEAQQALSTIRGGGGAAPASRIKILNVR